MKIQITLEILISMILSLLIVAFVLHAFSSARFMIRNAQSTISAILNSTNSYYLRLL